MRKWMGIAANDLYPVGVMQLFLQRIMAPLIGGGTDTAVVAEAATVTSQHLDLLEQELVTAFLTGEALSLAECH